MATTRLRGVKVKAFSAVDAATLESDMNTWLLARGEETFVSVAYQIDGTNFTALVFYTA